MANTPTVTLDLIEGVNSVVYGTILLSGTYATNGETLSPTVLGLSNIKFASVAVTTSTTTVSTAYFNPTTGKIVLFAPAGTEVANGTSLTGISLNFRALGA